MSDLFFKLDREELARLGASGLISIREYKITSMRYEFG